jgi:hypothetical protein
MQGIILQKINKKEEEVNENKKLIQYAPGCP